MNDLNKPMDSVSGCSDIAAVSAANGSEKPSRKRANVRRLTRAAMRRAQDAITVLDEHGKLDRRRTETQLLIMWDDELVAALGGDESISPQRRTLCRLAAQTKLQLYRVDQYLAEPKTPFINRGKRKLHPIVTQRMQMAEVLIRQLTALGLDRITKDVGDLHSYMQSKTGAP